MAQLIPVADIRNRDYSSEFGTVVNVTHSSDNVTVKFQNGLETTYDKNVELLIEQGGRF